MKKSQKLAYLNELLEQAEKLRLQAEVDLRIIESMNIMGVRDTKVQEKNKAVRDTAVLLDLKIQKIKDVMMDAGDDE
jgi:hypothetical protein